MKSLKRVWAAAQRNPIAKRNNRESERSRQATITILIHFDRISVWIPAGCALRWAQKDEGGILGQIVKSSATLRKKLNRREPTEAFTRAVVE